MVTIYADDENWTARAGRSGMHPDDIFRPVNQLSAGEPTVVVISQSNECGAATAEVARAAADRSWVAAVN